jgi:hypothetical protein
MQKRHTYSSIKETTIHSVGIDHDSALIYYCLKKIMMRNWMYVSLLMLSDSIPGAAQVSLQDSLALVSLYDATDGPNWKNNSNWLLGPVSTWYGVTLQGDRVYVLNLYDNGLNGYIPADIGQLTDIVEIDLRKSTFTGAIPNVFSDMSKLYQLSLSDCGLTGVIPSSLGSCPQFARLNISNNQLTGNIPASLASCTQMIHLLARQNNLTGPFPEVIRSWQGLERLDLAENSFSGPIPTWIAELDQLYWLFLEEIPFDGPMPFLGDKPNLTQFSLSQNTVTGNLEDVLGYYPNLTYCTIENTQLSGLLSPDHFNPETIIRLHILHSEINALGNFTDWVNYPNFFHMIISYNQLDFDDLLPNSTMPANKFLCSPQQPIGMDTIVTLFPGEAYAIYSPMQDGDIQYQWYFNQMLIEGVENYDLILPPFTSELVGDFYFTATHDALPNATLQSAITTLVEGTSAVSDLQSGNMHIFPNPVTDHFTADIELHTAWHSYSLMNETGQVLWSKLITDNTIDVSTADLPAGVYFLQLHAPQKNSQHKIIKL